MSGAALLLREVAETTYEARSPRPVLTDASDPDAIETLGDEIALLSAHIHAATHRLLVLIAQFDRLRGWEPAGYSCCAHWLSVRTGIDRGAAREKVRAARALEELPLTSAAMSRGELSFSQVRALTRAADASTDADLLELARGATTEQLERMIRAWKKGTRQDELAQEHERFESRRLSIFPDDDGMYVIHGRLMPEVAALLMRAIEAGSHAIYHEQRVPGAGNETQREAAQRRADAIALVAERALAVGFGAVGSGGGDVVTAQRQSVMDPEVAAAAADTDEMAPPQPPAAASPLAPAASSAPTARIDAPMSGTRAQRYQVVLHVDAATLSADAEPGRCEFEDGTRLSAETSRRLACDASVIEVTQSNDGSVLDIGRRRRTVSSALRRALDMRDRGCRFPGCGRRFTDAHHVKHWADGGVTSLSNCMLLCGYHHRLVHEGGWRVAWWDSARPAFIDPRGQAHFDGRWQPPKLGAEPVTALVTDNLRRGVTPHATTAGAKWRRDADIPDGVYFRASEAL